jgi:hypothetical protein
MPTWEIISVTFVDNYYRRREAVLASLKRIEVKINMKTHLLRPIRNRRFIKKP